MRCTLKASTIDSKVRRGAAIWKMLTELTSTDFIGQTLKREGTLAVVFLASWCPFCRQFQPAFETAAKISGTLWASVDLSDDDNKLWKVFNVEIVPTVILFKDGKPVWRRDGVPGRGLSGDVIKEAIGQMKLLG
jgi:thioredoxin 1